MASRRDFLRIPLAAALFSLSRPVLAEAAEAAASFIKTTGDRLVTIVNSSVPVAQKRKEIGRIVDTAVDVDGVGRFCLGRFWRQATPDQQKAYLALFHDVLIINISDKLGEYQGVRFTMGRTRSQDDTQIVSTVVERPNNPPATVEWVVGDAMSNPKIVDVIAEGTSLRITQRSDYASYLQRNSNNIDALISAMRNQVTSS